MATITQVRNALADTITSAIPELNGYHNVPEVVQVPAIVVRPSNCNYIVGGGTCQIWMYDVFVLVARTEADLKQDQLDSYLSTTGTKSIPAVLRSSYTLGLTGVDVVLEKMTGYGGQWEAARIMHIGAQLHVRVTVTE